jgi:hypothetical protein
MKNKIKTIWDSDTSSWNKEDLTEAFVDSYGRLPADDNELYAFMDECNSEYFDDVICEIQSYESCHGKQTYVVLASIGRWNGTFDGGDIMEGMESIFRKCFEDYNHVYVDGRRLKISAVHHDGTNSFEIRELTEKGIAYFRRNEYDVEPQQLHAKLFNSSQYSREVKMFADIYGW